VALRLIDMDVFEQPEGCGVQVRYRLKKGSQLSKVTTTR